jgi:esterase
VAEAQLNGIRLHYEEHGAGEPILCIHGGGSSALMWTDAFSELAKLGRVIAYDRRGCTRSERPQPYERTTLGEQADDAAALLEHLGAEPAVVIGRSYGGAVAVELALRDPGAVRALALLEGDALGLTPAGLAWTTELRDGLREVAARDGAEAAPEALFDRVMGTGVWESLPKDARELLSQNGEALLAELEYVDQPNPAAEAFAGIEQPVLLVAASDSPPEQRAMTEAMAAALPNARTETVEGGHLVNPASGQVLAFIAEVLEGR